MPESHPAPPAAVSPAAVSPAEAGPGVFVFTAPKYTTTTTVVAGESGGCLVIDPAISAADLSALAAWLTARGLVPVAGWSTHPHWDHVLWSAELGADVPRYGTPGAVAAATRRRAALIQEADAEVPGHDRPLLADLTALGPDVIPWDGPEARVIAHDAHAPGHGAVYLPARGVLVAGDMVSDVEIPLLDMDSPDPLDAYWAGLDRLASVPGVRVVVPGHGHVGDGAAFRSRVSADGAYLDALEAGRDVRDPRLAAGGDWLRAEHARQLRLALAPE